MLDFLAPLFSSDGFMPRGHCYLWQPGVIWLHVTSDAIIALAYTTIPFTLLYFVRRRRGLLFHWIFLCFGVFIVACGATHYLEILTLWAPWYWLYGGVKAITAVASLFTAVLLVRLVPRALALVSARPQARITAISRPPGVRAVSRRVRSAMGAIALRRSKIISHPDASPSPARYASSGTSPSSSGSFRPSRHTLSSMDVLRAVHVGARDRRRSILHEHLDELTRERVHEPRLPRCERKGSVHRVGQKHLSRLACVLRIERGDLVVGEAQQRERLGLDVERARRTEPIAAAGGDLVVPHVAQADQRERVRKSPRTRREPGAELTQHRDERLVLKRVDLVEKDDERTRRRVRPRRERRAEAPSRRRVGERRRLKLGRELPRGSASKLVEEHQLRSADVVRKRRSSLHRNEQCSVSAAGAETSDPGRREIAGDPFHGLTFDQRLLPARRFAKGVSREAVNLAQARSRHVVQERDRVGGEQLAITAHATESHAESAGRSEGTIRSLRASFRARVSFFGAPRSAAGGLKPVLRVGLASSTRGGRFRRAFLIGSSTRSARRLPSCSTHGGSSGVAKHCATMTFLPARRP